MEPASGGSEVNRRRPGAPVLRVIRDEAPIEPPAPPPAPVEPSWWEQATTIPNLLTYVRIVAVPFFVWAYWNNRMALALLLFGGAALTDGLDGLLARVLHQRTRLGTLLDPFADKLLTVSALVILVAHDRLPSWLLALVLVRDGGIALAVALSRRQGVTIPSTPTRIGKYATFCLAVTMTLALARDVSGSATIDGYVAAGTLLSMQCVTITIVQYFLRWRRSMRRQQ